jgi:hypothetical protein
LVLPKGTRSWLAFFATEQGRSIMGQTFRQMFARIDPSRRAQVVFGMDQLHRKYIATTGGLSRLPYDPAEHLTDEETIRAYLALVREVADPYIMMQARVDAARARKRLSEETGSRIDGAPSDLVQRGVWPRRSEGLFNNYLPKPDLQRSLADAGSLAGRPSRHSSGADRGKRLPRSSEPQ